jgi:LacI family transcriptional regulator
MSSALPRRPTMRDVALAAGTSFKTVSRVVNGEPAVSGELLARIQLAIDELGYRPDDRARRLRQGGTQTGVIGFALVDVANPFFSALLRGIEEVAVKHGYLVLAGSTDANPARENQLIDAFVARRVDGFIVVSSGTENSTLRAELLRGTPVVFLDLEPELRSSDTVRSDHLGGARLATSHLISHGHRDIAFFGDDDRVFSATLRAEGYRGALRDAGVTPRPDRVVHGRHSAPEWRAIIRDHLSTGKPPTAIVTAQNFITIGAAHALRDLGVQHTVAQVGFDDIDLADVVEPGITVIAQDPPRLGRVAAERLFARIAGTAGKPRRRILTVPLIERGSGEIPPPRSRRSP